MMSHGQWADGFDRTPPSKVRFQMMSKRTKKRTVPRVDGGGTRKVGSESQKVCPWRSSGRLGE